MGIGTFHLLFQGLNILRKKAVQFEYASFGGRKGGAFVEVWGSEEGHALEGGKLVWYEHGLVIEGDRKTYCESTFLWTRG